MKNSLSKKLALVAFAIAAFSGCQTAKIEVTELDWYNPYYGADRRPANVDPGTLFKLLVSQGTDSERIAAVKFLIEKGGAEFAPLEKAYRFAVRGGRLYNGQKLNGKLVEDDFAEFGKLFEKDASGKSIISEESQSKVYVEYVSKEKQFTSRIEGNTAFRTKAMESANLYRAKELGKKKQVIITKAGADNGSNALAKGTVTQTYDELPDLPAEYAVLRRNGHSADDARKLVNRAYSIFERTKTGTTRAIVKGVEREVPFGGISIFGKDTCKNLADAESFETILRQADEFDRAIEKLPLKCLSDVKNLRQLNAVVVINDNIAHLGRTPAAAHEVAIAYDDCGQMIKLISEGAMSPSVVRAVNEASKTPGAKSLPAYAVDCR